MTKEVLLIADDLLDRSAKGRLRSRLLRENALVFTKKMKLHSDLLYVHDVASPFLKRKDLQILEESFKDIKNSIEEQFKKAGVKGRVQLKAGSPVLKILTQVESSQNYKILAIGTHHSHPLNFLRLGSITEEILRQSQIPVMVLGPEAQKNKSLMNLDKNFKILLLTDLSQSSHEAEFFALSICQHLNCSVDIMHCLGDRLMKTRIAVYGSGYVPANPNRIFAEMTDQAHKKLNRIARNWKHVGVQATPILCTKEESIQKTLSKISKTKYQFIILGSHGRNALLKSFLGSVARIAIDKSPVPVFIVRSAERIRPSETS